MGMTYDHVAGAGDHVGDHNTIDLAILQLQDDINNTEAILRWDGATGSQPLRSSVTSDTTRPVCWRQPAAPPTTTGYAIAGLDVWEATSA